MGLYLGRLVNKNKINPLLVNKNESIHIFIVLYLLDKETLNTPIKQLSCCFKHHTKDPLKFVLILSKEAERIW